MLPVLDPATNTVLIGDTSVQLTGKEAEALLYLLERPGEIVSREAFERKVWKLRAGVRSETVPVTLRRLRAKLTKGGYDALETLRGQGWRLKPVQQATQQAPPRFGTPYLPRPEVEANLRSLLDADWRIVSLVGPPGIGKTRTAASLLTARPMLWVNIDDAANVEAVVGLLLAAAGLHDGALADLQRHLTTSGDRLWIDQAEDRNSLVLELLERLPEVPLFFTSAVPLGRPDEATVQLARLDVELGRRFLRERMAASRWSTDPPQSTLDATVEMLDGVPHALELAASYPPGLDTLLEELGQGELPYGPEGDGLAALVERSLTPLGADETAVLQQLALCRAPLQEREIGRWLGRAAVGTVRQLAARSLLVRREDGWSMLRITRVTLLQMPGDWSTWQARWDTWLLQRMLELETLFARDMRRDIHNARRLLDDAIALLPRLGPEATGQLVYALRSWMLGVGPGQVLRDLTLDALRRHPDEPVVAALAIRYLPLAPTEIDARLDQVEAQNDPLATLAAFEVRSALRVETLDPRRVERLRSRLAPGIHQVEIDVILARLAMEDRTNDPLAIERSHLQRVAGWDAAEISIRHYTTIAYSQRGETEAARRTARTAARRAAEIGLPSSILWADEALARASVDPDDTRPSLEAYRSLSAQAAALGLHERAALFAVVGGVMAFSAGEIDTARDLFGNGARTTLKVAHSTAQRMVSLIALAEGQAGAAAAIERDLDDDYQFLQVGYATFFRFALAYAQARGSGSSPPLPTDNPHRLAKLLYTGLPACFPLTT